MESCPICEEHLEEISQVREVRIGTRSTRVLDQFLRCPVCEEEFYLPGQMDGTLTRAAEALRKEEGLLTPSEVQTIRLRYSLSQQAFERLLGVGPKTVVRWEKGTVFQNHATDSLLRVLDRFPEVARFLADLHGVPLPDSAKMASG